MEITICDNFCFLRVADDLMSLLICLHTTLLFFGLLFAEIIIMPTLLQTEQHKQQYLFHIANTQALFKVHDKNGGELE